MGVFCVLFFFFTTSFGEFPKQNVKKSIAWCPVIIQQVKPMMSISTSSSRGREFKPLEGGRQGEAELCNQALRMRCPDGQDR